ncbi:MAG TPA: LpqB family beta-propeller domain-containing protein [Armatimonadota bacterium]|nr:LpqB family beta-propeller domain-containing protein [Armatimonadota bacterium]
MKALLRINLWLGLCAVMAFVFNGCGGGGSNSSPILGPQVSFSSQQSVIMSGNSTTLSWKVTDATHITITSTPSSNVSTNDSMEGTASVSPTVTTIYTLTATNSGGQTTTARVTVVVVESGKIAYVSSNSGPDQTQLYIMDSDGKNARVLSTAGYGVSDPSISPDGTKVAFVSTRNGNKDIYVASTDGSGQAQQITSNSADDTQPTWSYDGSQLAWTRVAHDASPNTIVIGSSDGTSEQELISDACNPSWSPTENKLAYTTKQSGKETILSYDLDQIGNNITQIASLADDTISIDRLSWSRNGQIVYGCYDSTLATPVGDIYVVNVADGTVTPLIVNSADDGGPSWSPSGNQLVFYTNRDGNYELYVANADGTHQTRLTNNTTDEGLPCWSRLLHRSK